MKMPILFIEFTSFNDRGTPSLTLWPPAPTPKKLAWVRIGSYMAAKRLKTVIEAYDCIYLNGDESQGTYFLIYLSLYSNIVGCPINNGPSAESKSCKSGLINYETPRYM